MNGNELTITTRTMDSREIAELLKARHADIVRSIESQLPLVGYTPNPYTYQHTQNGQTYKCYKLPYRETMILVSGYSVELRAKVIDRWMELETKEAKKLPTTFAEALRLAADQAEQIQELTPKAETYDRISNATGLRLLSEVGKVNGIGPRKIFDLLEGKGIIYRSRGSWVPKQEYQDSGYFITRDRIGWTDSNGEDHMEIQIYVTPKGELWIAKKLFAQEVAS